MKDIVVYFEGYLAELIALQAEQVGQSPSDYINSFFETGCNAPKQA